jgi:hypothetical protein
MTGPVKTAFPVMTPKINEALVDRLLKQSEAKKLAGTVEKQASSTQPVSRSITPNSASILQPQSPPNAISNGHHPAPAGAQKPPPEKAAGPMAPHKVPVLVLVSTDQQLPSPGIIRSRLSGDIRQIHVVLSKTDPLMSKALERADTAFTKFICALLLSEWCHFWSNTHEGRLFAKALRQAAGIPKDTRLWWSGLAGVLAQTPLLDKIQTLPLYGPNGQSGQQSELFTLAVTLRRQTQILGWQPKPNVDA